MFKLRRDTIPATRRLREFAQVPTGEPRLRRESYGTLPVAHATSVACSDLWKAMATLPVAHATSVACSDLSYFFKELEDAHGIVLGEEIVDAVLR